MAKANSKKFEMYRTYAQYFTMAMALIYALYWAILSITNTDQTGGVHTFGDVLLVLLVAGGLVMGILYAMVDDKKKK